MAGVNGQMLSAVRRQGFGGVAASQRTRTAQPALLQDMRNIFDQYSQPENRITHALTTALNEDRRFLDAFLADIAGRVPPQGSGSRRITGQSYPGTAESGGDEEAESERRGIPEAWITAGEDWRQGVQSRHGAAPARLAAALGRPRAVRWRDAVIDIDLRTRSGDEEGAKRQPEWTDAAVSVSENRRPNTNLELQIGGQFPIGLAQRSRIPRRLTSWPRLDRLQAVS